MGMKVVGTAARGLRAPGGQQILRQTYEAIPRDIVDEVILTDDASDDATASVALSLGIHTVVHEANRGYGGNQKTCYLEALGAGADIVVMVHPDNQYDATSIPRLIKPIIEGKADLVLGSRLLGGREETLKGGMPIWKYISNRFLTTVENLAMGRRFSECHTGYRAYSRRFLETVPFLRNDNGFVFDTEVIFQAVNFGLPVVEVPISTRYFADASSVGFGAGVVYGLGTLVTALRFALHRWGIVPCAKFRS